MLEGLREKFKTEEDYKTFLSNEMQPRFQKLAKMIKTDMALMQKKNVGIFKKVDKVDIIKWVQAPQTYATQLQKLSLNMMSFSTHYRRLIEYFAKMGVDSAYVLEPYNLPLDKSKINKDTFKLSYSEHLNLVDKMNIEHEYLKIKMELWTVGIFYGYEWEENNSYYIQKLDRNYCRINGIEDGSFVFQFNFQYFDTYPNELVSASPEFKTKYKNYKDNKDTTAIATRGKNKQQDDVRWQTISTDNSICLKLDENVTYSVPPFTGLFLDVYDIQDYKELKKSKEELQNYALLIGHIPINTSSGTPDDFLLDLDTAIEFGNKLSASLPDQIGFGLSIYDNVDFIQTKAGENSNQNVVSDAEKSLWDASGVNQNIFSGEATTEGTLKFSVKADETNTFSINRQFERWLNRKFKFRFDNKKYKFRFDMLDVTIYNYEEKFKLYKQGVTAGAPVKTYMLACLGISPSATINMEFLENQILDLNNKFIPPLTSNVMSGNSTTEQSKDGSDGRPKNDSK